MCCPSHRIAIHSGRQYGDIMQKRSTKSGLPRQLWRWKDTTNSGKDDVNLFLMWKKEGYKKKFYILRVQTHNSHTQFHKNLITKYTLFSFSLCFFKRKKNHLYHLAYEINLAIFQTWFLRNARTNIEALPISKLLSLRYSDTRT